MQRIRVSSLQWAMGGFYALIGILLLMIPHRLIDLPGYILSLRPTEAGLAALIVGLSLLVCAQFTLPAWASVSIHLLSGFGLVSLGVHTLQVGAGENPTAPVLLGAGLILAAFAPRADPGEIHGSSNDLFSLTAGLVSLGAALSLLLDLSQQRAPLALEPIVAWLFAIGFIVSSLWLIGMQLYAWQHKTSPVVLKRAARAGYMFAGLTSIGFALIALIPQHHWISTGLYAITGFVLLLTPWTPAYREMPAPASLRLRLAFILSAMLAIPLLASITWIGHEFERSRLDEALVSQKAQAGAVAAELAEYLGRHQAAAAALARQAGLIEAAPDEQKYRMGTFAAAYSDITSFTLYDPQGKILVATAQTGPILPVTGPESFDRIASLTQVNLSNTNDTPVLGFSAPILNESNEITGLVMAGLPMTKITAILEDASRAVSGEALLVDTNGQLLARSNPAGRLVQTDLRGHPAVAALLAGGEPAGAIQVQAGGGDWLTAYALIADLGWVLLTEQPADNVVAGIHAARERGFAFLIGFILTGLAAGLVLGNWLSRPFQTVTAALGEIQAGSRLALPPVSFQEGYDLVAEFDALRKRLANREQALEALRATRRSLEQQLIERSTDLKVVTDQLMNAKELLMRSEKDQAWLETALWESERRFRSLGELIPYGVWVSDPGGNTIFVSQPYLDLLNITIDDVEPFGGIRQGQTEDMTAAVKSWMQSIRAGSPWEFQHQVIEPGGEVRTILTRGRPVRDEKGQITSWVGVHLDVTESRQTEEKISDQKKRFRVALSNSATMVSTNDLTLRYTSVHNPLHGLTTEEMIGKRDEDLFLNADLSELIEFKQAVIQQRKPIRKDVHVRIGNRTLTYDVSAEPHMDRYGEVDEIIVATVDITDRTRMAEDIEHNTLLIELQHRLNDQHEIERIKFSRDLHDGPLQDLIAITFQLQQVIFQAKEPVLLERLQEVQASLQDEVRNLRTFCYALRPPLLSRFGLAKAIESFAEGFQTRYPDLKLNLDLMEDGQHLPERVRAALFRIFQEAIGNTARHANASEASVRLYFEGSRAVLEVQDNGDGFTPPSDWLSLARNGQLGLAGIRERVEGLGGTMELNSAPGSGTRLYVEVPWQREPNNVPF